MNDQSMLFGVSMRGWICVIFALGLTAIVCLKIPVDTQYYTIVNSVVVAYVVNRHNGNTKPTPPSPNA